MGIYEDRKWLEEYEKEHPEEFLWGVNSTDLYETYFNGMEFPGTKKYPPNHPIWDCHTEGKFSPKQAWYDWKSMMKAIDNLYYIMHKLEANGKEQDFVARVYSAFGKIYDIDYLKGEEPDPSALAKEILMRFTIAKIAPKVGAMQPSHVEKVIKESGIDLSCGVYVPMAGFGGIVEAAKRWFKKHNLEPKIEAYDINSNFCKYYGWTQRDVLAQKVKTDKIVICCPPFAYTEQWEGTPDKRHDKYKTNYLDFHTWCKLIKEYIEASNYIFLGPDKVDMKKSKYKSGAKNSGLFVHREGNGTKWYKEYSL